MRRLLATLVLSAGCSWAVATAPLWGKVASGMTASEVKSVYPQSQELLAPPLVDGMAELLTTPTQVIGQPATAGFFFKDGRLGRVSVSLKETDAVGSGTLGPQVLAALRGKYGNEGAHEVVRTTPGDYHETWTWMSTDKRIELRAIKIESTIFLVVSYSDTQHGVDNL